MNTGWRLVVLAHHNSIHAVKDTHAADDINLYNSFHIWLKKIKFLIYTGLRLVVVVVVLHAPGWPGCSPCGGESMRLRLVFLGALLFYFHSFDCFDYFFLRLLLVSRSFHPWKIPRRECLFCGGYLHIQLLHVFGFPGVQNRICTLHCPCIGFLV